MISQSQPADELGAAAPKRLRGFDALRGIAAMAVMLHHHTWYYDVWFHDRGSLPIIFAAGHFGVELFFIISGFVIFLTIDRAQSVYEFAVSRIARLYPAFWAALVLAAALLLIHPMPPLLPPDLLRFVANLTMAPALFGQMIVDWSYWTLAYEVIFYVFLGLLFGLRLTAYTEYVFLAWLAIDFGLRVAHIAVPYRLSIVLLLGYVNFFGIGICLYRAWRGTATKATYVLLALCIAITALGGGEKSFYASGAIYLGVTLCFTWLIWLAAKEACGPLCLPPLLFLGRISYAIYLLHQVTGYEVIQFCQRMGLSALAGLVLAVMLTLGLATLLDRFVEEPAKVALRAFFKCHRPAWLARQRPLVPFHHGAGRRRNNKGLR